MRFVVFGAGAIGGVVGAQLHKAGHDVILIARGRHGDAIARNGLTFETPGVTEVLKIAVTDDPSDVTWTESTVVLLSVKSQDTQSALDSLIDHALPATPIVCMQNGVENERQALRRFGRVYAMCVLCPTTYIDPGVVQAHSAPLTGIMDLGCYPSGVDATATEIAQALTGANFSADALEHIMRWKYRKLLSNLANGVEALCGPSERFGPLAKRVGQEGADVLAAAGIDVASREEDRIRRGNHLGMDPTASRPWSGGSSWQSLARGAGSIEADYLNGEICLLGRTHGVATPANALVQRMSNEMAKTGAEPGTYSSEVLLAMVESAS